MSCNQLILSDQQIEKQPNAERYSIYKGMTKIKHLNIEEAVTSKYYLYFLWEITYTFNNYQYCHQLFFCHLTNQLTDQLFQKHMHTYQTEQTYCTQTFSHSSNGPQCFLMDFKWLMANLAVYQHNYLPSLQHTVGAQDCKPPIKAHLALMWLPGIMFLLSCLSNSISQGCEQRFLSEESHDLLLNKK